MKNKGITLVALVVTIIIMLILAGVTIGAVIGNNGLFTRTKQAVEKYKESQGKEKNSLIDIESYIDENVSKEIKDIEIKSDISYNDTFSEAQITYIIKYDGIIKKISINEEDVTIPEKTEEKYVVETKTNKNGTYRLELINDKKDYKINEAIVTELVSDLEIHNVDELLAFRDKVNQGGTYEGKTVKLMEDLSLSNVCGEEKGDWIPIGSEEKPFLGTFEGNNKTISELYANNGKSLQGLFGYIGSKGTVKNLTIEGNMKMGGNSGGLVGRNDGMIESCISNVEIHSSGWRNGGIAGSNYGKIYKSMNIANIETSDSAGGIAGLNGGIISSCFNKGNINSKRWSAGGITAINGYSKTTNDVKAQGKIYNCKLHQQMNTGLEELQEQMVGNLKMQKVIYIIRIQLLQIMYMG